LSPELLIGEAPSPRDRVIARLVALNGTTDAATASRLLRRLQGSVYEAAAGEGLYGIPPWLVNLSHLDGLIDPTDRRLCDALEEVRRLLGQAQPGACAGQPASSPRDRQHALDLIRSCRPAKRDEGWRLVRTDVPMLIGSTRLADPATHAILLGVQVEPGEARPDERADGIHAEPGTMDEDFLSGVRDGRNAAMHLLRTLGAREELVGRLRHLSVRALGIDSAERGGELLTGRSAGLPVALGLLQRASEFDEHPLPEPAHVATGSFLHEGIGNLDGISHGAALAKLDAVVTDGRRGTLVCPFVTDDETDAPLRRDSLDGRLAVVNDLREAAEVTWGSAWREWVRLLQHTLVRTNLPGPTYSAYVERPRVEHAVAAGLESRLPILALEGPGGAGKSAVARELAGRLLADGGRGYEAIVWVSDRAQPGSTTLAKLLGTIARLLDYREEREEGDELRSLLWQHPILLVLDNFETVRDRQVGEWLTCLPERSKAIVTARVGGLPAALDPYTHKVRVDGLETSDAFVRQCLERLQLDDVAPDVIEDVLAITGANPKAIELAFGYLKSSPAEHAVDVNGLRRASARLFAELVQWNFDLLDCQERWLLLATEFHPYGATLDDLTAVAGIAPGEAAASLERLLDSGLLDKERAGDPGAEVEEDLLLPHPVGRDFIARRLEEEASFRLAARRRWLERQAALACEIGFCPDDVERLRKLDRPGARETLVYAADVAFAAGMDEIAIAIARDARYYFYVRGYWMPDRRSTNVTWALAAHRLGDAREEYDALTYQANIMSKQGLPEAVEQLIPRLQELERTAEIPEASRRRSRHAEALYFLARREYAKAEAIWAEHLAVIDRAHEDYSPAARWMAVCLQRDGRPDEARRLAMHAREHALEFGLRRAQVATTLQLTELDLADDHLAAVDQALRELQPLIAEVDDSSYTADFAFYKGVAAARSGDATIGRLHLHDALERYLRLGRRRRAEEARAELDRIAIAA
jgi:NB-ARC domain